MNCAALGFSDEEGPVHSVGSTVKIEGSKKLALSLVGKLLAGRQTNRDAFRVLIPKNWRSHKERSSYAPKGGLQYDGSYWIEKCWRKIGIQGFKVCRYLFVRCDYDPAPWTSDEHGDWHRPLPIIPKLKNAVDVTKRKEGSSWDFNVTTKPSVALELNFTAMHLKQELLKAAISRCLTNKVGYRI
ncbi:hypothetical protein ACOSQ3_026872 [Xanthoceras sorbifolium]